MYELFPPPPPPFPFSSSCVLVSKNTTQCPRPGVRPKLLNDHEATEPPQGLIACVAGRMRERVNGSGATILHRGQCHGFGTSIHGFARLRVWGKGRWGKNISGVIQWLHYINWTIIITLLWIVSLKYIFFALTIYYTVYIHVCHKQHLNYSWQFIPCSW